MKGCEYMNGCGETNNDYTKALRIIEEANRNRVVVGCCCPPSVTGPTGPTGPSGGPTGPTARCNKSSIYFFKW